MVARLCLWRVVLATSLMATSPALAQTATEVAAAKARFDEGLAAEKSGNFKDAVIAFRAAASIKKTPQILYHLGHCEKETGQLVEALVDLERAIELARQSGVPEVEAAAKPEADAIRRRIGKIEVTLPAGVEPTSVSIDGAAIALATVRAPLLVNPGDHEVVVSFGSAGESRQKASVAEGQTAKIVIDAPAAKPATVEPPATAPPPASSTAPAETPPPEASPSKVVPLALIGGGAVAVVVGGVLFTMARLTASDLADKCQSTTTCDRAFANEYNDGKMQNTLGLVLGGVGLAAAGVGTFLLLRSPSTSVRAQVGLGGAVVTGRF